MEECWFFNAAGELFFQAVILAKARIVYNYYMNKNYYVYILGNSRPTLYIGVTSDLTRRIYEHKQGLVDGFTKKYNLKKLLYFEITNDINTAISREKQLKHWNRDWKLELVRKTNPNLIDLYDSISH